MRGQFLILALLALTLPACGSAKDNSSQPHNNASQLGGAEQVTSQGRQQKGSSAKAPATSPASEAATKKAVAAARVYPAAVKLKTASGAGIGAVVLPDTRNESRASAEAQKLAKLGVTTIVVNGPTNAPTDPTAFERAVGEARLAVETLRRRPGIDPNRVGLVGEGVGAHVGAVAMGRAPRSVAAAVLADIGGVVVPRKSYAPEHWLRRALGVDLLFQRDVAERAMTRREVKRLMLASPPGTLMQQYKSLGADAEAARDQWIRDHLIAR
jgi:hypothetical protein